MISIYLQNIKSTHHRAYFPFQLPTIPHPTPNSPTHPPPPLIPHALSHLRPHYSRIACWRQFLCALNARLEMFVTNYLKGMGGWDAKQGWVVLRLLSLE